MCQKDNSEGLFEVQPASFSLASCLEHRRQYKRWVLPSAGVSHVLWEKHMPDMGEKEV